MARSTILAALEPATMALRGGSSSNGGRKKRRKKRRGSRSRSR